MVCSQASIVSSACGFQNKLDASITFDFAVYPDGRVCISILHPPGDDPSGYELASERWTPVHTVSLLALFGCD